MKVGNRFSVIAGVLAAVICSSALEAAAQQQPILGCVKPGRGLLRIPSGNEGCKAQETPLGFNDLPLLVALRTQVEQLQTEVDTLQANGVGAGMVAARIVGLPSQNGTPEDRFGTISGTSDQSLDTGSVAMLSPPVPVVARTGVDTEPRQRSVAEAGEGRRKLPLGAGMRGARLTASGGREAPIDRLALKPYRGRPAVRNFRGEDGNVGIIPSPVRAIVLLDRLPQMAVRSFSCSNLFILSP